MKNKKYLNTFLATTVAASMVTPQIVSAAKNEAFNDVSNSYAKDAITYLANKGIVNGLGNQKFAPMEAMNRESFAVLLAKTLGLKPKATGSSFKDVSPWAQGYVAALEEKGIVDGYSKNVFGAQDNVTREQMTVFFIRAMGFEKKAQELNLSLTYKDANSVSSWAKPVVAFAEKIGLIQGYPDGTFKAKDKTLRQDVASLTYRYIDPTNTDKDLTGGVVKENRYLKKANEVVSQYSVPLTVQAGNVTKSNVSAYTVKGTGTPGSTMQISVVYQNKDGSFGVKSKTVYADENGKYEKTIDLSDVPDGNLTIHVGYWGSQQTVEKTVTKNTSDQVSEETKKVSSIKPLADITIPVGGTYTLPSKVTVVYEDATEADVSVTWNATGVNVNTPGTYTVQGTIDGVTLKASVKVIVQNETEVKIPTKIETVPVGYAKQVGQKVKVQYLLLDANDEVVSGSKVRIKVEYFDEYGIKQLASEEIVTSDESGKISYEYTSLDARRDYISAVSIDNPANVRNEYNITVDWSLAPTGLIEVDAPQDIKLGEGTMRTYTVTFKDKDGKPLPKNSDVFVFLGEQASGTTTVGGDFTKVLAEPQYAKAKINNFEGKVVLNVTDENKKVIKPLFYYHVDKNVSTHTILANDPLVKAGAVTFEKQIPTVTLTEKQTGSIEVGQNRVIQLKAVDQYGNPYLGVVRVGLEEAMDNLNETKYGSIKFDVDANRDGVMDSTNLTGAYHINFKALNLENSVVDIYVKDGLDLETATVTAYVDENGNNILDPADYQVKTPVKFEDIYIKTIDIRTSKDKIAEGNTTFFNVSFKDQKGNAISLKNTYNVDIAFQILDEDGNVITNYKAPANEIALETDPTSDPYDFAEGTDGGDTLYYTPTSPEYEQFVVKFTSDTAGKYKLRVFLDQYAPSADQKKQEDEVFAEKDIIVEGAILTSGEVNVSSKFATNNKKESFQYVLQDQDRQTFVAKKDVTVAYTIENQGKSAVTIKDQDNTTFVIQPGTTTEIERVIEKSKSDYVLEATPNAADDALISVRAKAKGVDSTESYANITWVKVDIDSTNMAGVTEDKIYSGKVIAYKTTNDTGTKKGWYVLKTAVKNVLVDFETDKDQFIVDQNSDTQGKAFDEQLTVNDELTWEYKYDSVSGTGKEKHNLTNK